MRYNSFQETIFQEDTYKRSLIPRNPYLNLILLKQFGWESSDSNKSTTLNIRGNFQVFTQ